MAAAAPVIGSIITSYLVSTAVRELGPKIGLSDSASNLFGTIAGAYAGGYTYNTVAASQAAATVPPDLSAGVSGATATPSVASPSVTPPVSNIPGTPLAPSGSPHASTPSAGAGGGMLSQGAGADLTVGNVPSQATPPSVTPGSNTAQDIIKTGTGGKPEQSWMDRLFSPEKTMDLVMAGMQGYGEAGIRKEELEYPEKVAEKNARGWASAYPGQLSLTPYSPPSQGGN